MAWDDPMVWILLVGLGVLLFGSNKIPELARAMGKAKREFDTASRGLAETVNSEINAVQRVPRTASPQVVSSIQSVQPIDESIPDSDPLIVAARNEGIDTRGKTRSQIASELASRVHD
jgi:sec-independent protein translocase protein TatA